MADESLGHIDLRVISSAITGGTGGGGGESPIKKAEKFALEPLKGVEESFKKFGTLKEPSARLVLVVLVRLRSSEVSLPSESLWLA